MREIPDYQRLIARYLNDSANEKLRQEVADYCSQSAENQAYFEEMKRLWEMTSAASGLAQIDERTSVKRLKVSLRELSPQSSSLFAWMRNVAATLLFVFVGYWWYDRQSKSEMLTKTTLESQIDTLVLSDGSTLVLAGNSEVSYPAVFKGENREVTFTKGQIFFRIERDEQHPFKIKMGHSEVEVLGTSFNLKRTGELIDLAVKTGKVMFTAYESGNSSTLIAGEAMTYNHHSQTIVPLNGQNANAWMTKELIFVDTPLEEVCKQLSDYYGVEIRFNGRENSLKKFNATFKDESLEDALQVLRTAYKLKIANQNNHIITLTTP